MNRKKQQVPAIQRAVREFGSQANLAELLGVKPSMVSWWATGNKRVSAERAVQIEAVTKGLVTRKELRPDLWG